MIDDPVFSVTETGISAPSYEEIYEYLKGRMRNIFGDDINLDADTQDGQMVGIVAAAISDVNAQAIAVYNAYNPTTAKGVALDSAVKVNGITRQAASHSQVDLRIVGQAGTHIVNGVALDEAENKWNLPADVVVPPAGEITVTAIAAEEGDIRRLPGLSTASGHLHSAGKPLKIFSRPNPGRRCKPTSSFECNSRNRQRSPVFHSGKALSAVC